MLRSIFKEEIEEGFLMLPYNLQARVLMYRLGLVDKIGELPISCSIPSIIEECLQDRDFDPIRASQYLMYLRTLPL